jgi:hypothetical protein
MPIQPLYTACSRRHVALLETAPGASHCTAACGLLDCRVPYSLHEYSMWSNTPTHPLRQVNIFPASLVPMEEKLVGFDDDSEQ